VVRGQRGGWLHPLGFGLAGAALATTAIVTTLRRLGRTERTALELDRRVRARTRALEEANRELDAFSFSVSHDLRAPLRSIEGFATEVREQHAGALPDEARRHLDAVLRAAREMTRLIDALLRFARLQRETLDVRYVDMEALARSIAVPLVGAEPGRRIELAIAELPACDADPRLMAVVWQNLVSNAIKYSRGRDPAHVSIGGESTADEYVYSVRDDGAGFDAKQAERLFRPFQRLHSDAEFEGTGIGLALCARIVGRHQGWIRAEGEKGRGACIRFAIPKRLAS
jgi:light-regulated signal transduction histidine kinase (bacteriophytochrome)